MNNSEMLAQIIQIKIISNHLSIEHWIKYEVFTWQWWIGIAFVLIPPLLWWKLVDRRRLLEITVFGLIVNISAIIIDVVGSAFVLWNYTIRLLPLSLCFCVDFFLLPIIYMLIYQRYLAWKQFLVASTTVALALAFIVEPLAVYIKQYQLISWHYIYSFPIYVLIVVLAKLIADKLLSMRGDCK